MTQEFVSLYPIPPKNETEQHNNSRSGESLTVINDLRTLQPCRTTVEFPRSLAVGSFF